MGIKNGKINILTEHQKLSYILDNIFVNCLWSKFTWIASDTTASPGKITSDGYVAIHYKKKLHYVDKIDRISVYKM